uniref:Uncharacterized protein n=1 Tax=Scophthalmus maximus TaxID=52904 RepID=A0A8D3CED5_SCOMX
YSPCSQGGGLKGALAGVNESTSGEALGAGRRLPRARLTLMSTQSFSIKVCWTTFVLQPVMCSEKKQHYCRAASAFLLCCCCYPPLRAPGPPLELMGLPLGCFSPQMGTAGGHPPP